MIYAVYRVLYGEDFIKESINSVINFVDKVFICWTDGAFGDVTECVYKGERIIYPKNIDDVVDRAREIDSDKIEIVCAREQSVYPDNQFTRLMNELIIPKYGKPDYALFLEPDMVWDGEQLIKAFDEFKESGERACNTKQIELWKEFRYRVPQRKRSSCIFWNLADIDEVPKTLKGAELSYNMRVLDAYVYNLGFCASPRVMYWKHVLAIGFSQKIGDSKPKESWYKDKWLEWDYETNNKNLEISMGYEGLIPCILPYDVEELPEILKELL